MMFLHFLKSRIGILLVLTLIFGGIWHGHFTNIQKNSQVLGVSSSVCNGTLDLNCDSQANIADAKALIKYIAAAKSVKPTTPPPTPSMCGNGVCDSGESSKTCSADCSSPTPPPPPPPPTNTCGNGRCDNGETEATCMADCHTTPPPPPPPANTCGNGRCDNGETAASCSADCVTIPPVPEGDQPFPTARACPNHSNTEFHTLWNSVERCHYDHEHGETPFTSSVASTFPGFNLRTLLSPNGLVEIGHTNLSSSMENTHKHGGFKWQVTLNHPTGCSGFEGSRNGVNASVVQYHAFGNYAMELEGRIHTAAGLLRMCNTSNPNDYGYLYTTQFQDYGQRVVPYQGTVFNYPDTPTPAYDSRRGPYLTVDCIGNVAQCRTSREQILQRHLDANSNWSSKPTGNSGVVGSTLFQVFFRLRDTYQVFDWNDQSYPFTFINICSSDGGRTYDPANCEYNNTTTQLHEIAGAIPASWDNLAGFDTDSRVGRITAQGYTTRFGTLNRSCTSAGVDCHPIKMVNAFVGTYGSVLFYTPNKGTNVGPYLPERDIYFCNGRVCSENDAGATPSGWVGASN